MAQPIPADSLDKALATIEADVLPALSTLLQAVADKAVAGTAYDARSAERRDMSRQIIELTRFLAAVTADACDQS